MKALVQREFGSPGTLELQEIERPTPRSGEILVRVHATGLNAADRLMLRGVPYAIRWGAGGPRRPKPGFVAGRALAGRVEKLGPGTTGFQVGDEVMAESSGALAEFARVKAARLAPKPAALTFAEAAALPLGGTTALQCLRDGLDIQPGRRLLITGAAGGIGTFAVQIAKAAGAHVTAECGARNLTTMRELGADEVRDYESGSGPGQDYDAIFDLAGNHPLKALLRALKPGGTLLLSVGTGGRLLGPARRLLAASITAPLSGRKLRNLVARSSRDDLATLAAMVEKGQVHPLIDKIYPWPEAAAAMDRIDRGRPTGKVIVEISNSEED
jgi:NADPH:quinone reductase-like Zn-dependent oxidoreductase